MVLIPFRSDRRRQLEDSTSNTLPIDKEDGVEDDDNEEEEEEEGWTVKCSVVTSSIFTVALNTPSSPEE